MTKSQIMSMGPGRILMRYTLSFSDLTAAAKTQTINLETLEIGTIVGGVRIKSNVAFTGGGETAVTLATGSAAGATNSFSAAYSIFAAVADTTFQHLVAPQKRPVA